MKKVISLLLVVLLLLNVMGYYGLFLGLKYKNTQDITQRLDNENYLASETVTIKVPLAAPYLMDTDFERVNGEVEHNGEFYRLIKQKFTSDTLYIVCIKDTQSKHIKRALADYVKTFSDHPFNSKNAKTVPAFIKDFIPTDFSMGNSATGWSYSLVHSANEALTLHRALSIPYPPPKA